MIIGLSGYAQSGKDTVAAMLVEDHGFRRLAFADALKKVLADLNPIYWANAYGYEQRLSDLLVEGWEKAKQNDEHGRDEVRELLQRLGIACRKHLGEVVWVRAVMDQIDADNDRPLYPVAGGGADLEEHHYVISDCRFPNEAQAIVDRGGEVWRIHRPNYVPVNGHESETALDDWDFARRVDNNMSLRTLRARVGRKVERALADRD